MPVRTYSSAGSWFHCLQATSQALQPMHNVVSVKKPLATPPPLCCALALRGAAQLGALAARPANRPAARRGDPLCVVIAVAARAPARLQVTRKGLGLVDAHVGVEHDADQIVDDVARHQAL